MTDENVGSDQDNSHQITNQEFISKMISRTTSIPDQDNSHQITNQGSRDDLLFWPPVMYAFLYVFAPFEATGAFAFLAQSFLSWVALLQFVFGIVQVIARKDFGWAHISSALLVALMRYGPFHLFLDYR